MNFIEKIALQVAEELREVSNPLQKLAKGGGPSLTYPKQEVDEANIMSRIVELVEEELQKTLSEDDDWIQDVDADIERRGTEGVCTGEKFGSESCPPGSRRYNLAKTFRRIAKDGKKD